MTKETKAPDRDEIPWDLIKPHFQAGVRSLRNIADEFGISHVALKKHADKHEWTRDLKPKIDAGVKAAVNKAAVTKEVTAVTKITEKAIIDANVDLIAGAELVQREDVLLGLEVSRALMNEVLALTDPRFSGILEQLAIEFDESGPTRNGGWKNDKTNELYRYIISLAGRAKTAKDIAASHTAYIATQRKVLRMEDAANRGESTMDQLLSKVLESGQ